MRKAKLRPEKRFEANAHYFFKIKISRNCPEKILLSNFFQFCQNAFKTKISLEVHFRKKWIPQNFVTSSHIEKLSRNVQLTILRKRTHVARELFFYVELWPENTNPQHRHFPFAISKKFSETLYETKNPRQVF